MRGSLFAAQQMEQSAREMNDIVEKLLIMGGVREGRVLMQKIDLAHMLNDIQSLYPYIEVNCMRDFLQGDRTLVRCMLGKSNPECGRRGQSGESQCGCLPNHCVE
mgnify:CR=1 FL=1